MTEKIPNISEMLWTFEPEDVFEQNFKLERTGYTIVFETGKVTAQIDPEFYIKNKEIKNSIESEVKAIFQGVRTFNHKNISLNKYKVNVVYPDGSREYLLHVDTLATIAVASDSVDIIQQDKDGNIIYDSKAERIKSRKNFIELSAQNYQADEITKSIIDSYNNAITDKNNELIHLYEIRDCLVKFFGTEKKTKTKLSIPHNEWRNFGKLANNAPLKQGRHRGINPGNLRNAKNNELEEARKFSIKLISNYFAYIESINQ